MTATKQMADLIGLDLGTRSASYTARDAILYALSVGADAAELDLVYERDLRVLPTYGLALGLWAVETAGDLGAYDRLKSLHAAQRLRIHAALPHAGKVDMRARIADVWDKGKAAMVDIEVTSDFFAATYSIFLPGMGGWGGQRGPSHAASSVPGDLITRHSKTTENQAALYRLTGDLHPVHVDPIVASDYGFTRPILHGLCTLGIAAREVSAVARAHPCDLTYLEARFSQPVLPGDLLSITASTASGETRFEARVGDAPVLTCAHARFRN